MKTKTNEVLQKEVQDAIKWEPLLSAAQIGVTVLDGVVTLTGFTDSYASKLEAEDAVKNIAGVKALVEKIEIKYSDSDKKDDSEIALAVINAFNWNWAVPKSKIQVKVEKGRVTLSGEVTWFYQKQAAQKAVSPLFGVTGISNNILIKSEIHNSIEAGPVELALLRSWAVDGQNIKVHVSGNKVTLTGTVTSWFQKGEAARIAWSAPGVGEVANELIIEY